MHKVKFELEFEVENKSREERKSKIRVKSAVAGEITVESEQKVEARN